MAVTNPRPTARRWLVAAVGVGCVLFAAWNPASVRAQASTGDLHIQVNQAAAPTNQAGPNWLVVAPASDPDALDRPDLKGGIAATDNAGRLLRTGLTPGEYIVAAVFELDPETAGRYQTFSISTAQGVIEAKGVVVTVAAGETAEVSFVRREFATIDVLPPRAGLGQTGGEGGSASSMWVDHSAKALRYGGLLLAGSALGFLLLCRASNLLSRRPER